MFSNSSFVILTCFIVCLVASIQAQRCQTACPLNYDPVCGTLRRPNGSIMRCTFPNRCALNVRSCVHREPWRSTPGRCRTESNGCNRIAG
uniref:Kazal-like domain-containing protein n=1 Tax=Musca domestica TaxID=7370 RepID=A0A1I8NJV3_MUSDO